MNIKNIDGWNRTLCWPCRGLGCFPLPLFLHGIFCGAIKSEKNQYLKCKGNGYIIDL